MARICEIKEKEYLDKKFEAAKQIIPVMLTQYPPEYVIDPKKRASLIFNGVSIAENLLQELGYRIAGAPVSNRPPGQDSTAIRKLGDMFSKK